MRSKIITVLQISGLIAWCQASCGQTHFNGTSGKITSYNYPSNYPRNEFCIYYLDPIVPNDGQNYKIVFEFLDIDIPSRSAINDPETCESDYLSITEDQNSYPHEIARYCNNNLPQAHVVTHTNQAHLVFNTNADTDTGRGFDVEWTVVPESEIDDCGPEEFLCPHVVTQEDVCLPRSKICDGEVNCYEGKDEAECDLTCGGTIVIDSNSPTGTIVSPGWDEGHYPLEASCRWSVEDSDYVEGKTAIYVIFDTVDIKSSSLCYQEFIKVSDQDYNKNTTYCGTVPQPSVRVDSSKAFVEFKSDEVGGSYSHLHRGVMVTFLRIEINQEQDDEDEDCSYRCLNRRCVKSNEVCDGKNDCLDWSDEMYCSGTPVCGNQTIKPEFNTDIYPNNPTPSVGVVGGEVAVPGSWPWQVYVEANGGELCGGTLVAPQFIFSAAHCFYKISDHIWSKYTWILGVSSVNNQLPDKNSQKIEPIAFYTHPWFDRYTRDWDYSVIKLKKEVKYSDYISPVCLPPVETFNVGGGQPTVVTGFGDTHATGGRGLLKQAVVETWTNADCKSTLDADTERDNLISSRMVCAGYQEGGHDACQGDSGGPLVWYDQENSYWLLYGTVSWGWGCAEPNRPGVYSRVSQGLEWSYTVMLTQGWRGDH